MTKRIKLNQFTITVFAEPTLSDDELERLGEEVEDRMQELREFISGKLENAEPTKLTVSIV